MIVAAVLAAAVAQLLPPLPAGTTGEWVVVTVQRVIAPDQIQGQCFLQGRVDQVVRGRAFQAGDAIGLSMSCRFGGYSPAVATFAPQIPTVETLRSQKRVLVNVDAAGRVLQNGYYGLGAAMPTERGAASRR
jgi:hypothetical protein